MTTRGLSLALALATLGAPGCVTTETVPVQYRLPLRENSHGEEAARSCAETCSVANAHDAKGFFYCLSLCPDIQVRNGVACSGDVEDTPPEAFCYTRPTEVERPDPQAGQTALAVLVGILRVGAALAEIGEHAHHAHRHGHRR
ncbi:MAG TPA: hypothetical protein VHE30_23075 [Polyangiaceae bacterium]|nr:hypothetical protein [Polyangiaceae bacterium]